MAHRIVAVVDSRVRHEVCVRGRTAPLQVADREDRPLRRGHVAQDLVHDEREQFTLRAATGAARLLALQRGSHTRGDALVELQRARAARRVWECGLVPAALRAPQVDVSQDNGCRQRRCGRRGRGELACAESETVARRCGAVRARDSGGDFLCPAPNALLRPLAVLQAGGGRSGPAAVVVTRALRGAVQLVDAARRAPCDLLMNGMWTRPRTHLVCVRVAVHRVRVVVGCLLPVARATALAAVAFPRELARPALLLGGKYAWRRVRSRRSCELCGRRAHACLGEGGGGGGERCTASMALSARS